MQRECLVATAADVVCKFPSVVYLICYPLKEMETINVS